NSLGNPVTCYKGSRGLSPDSVFPPGVLTLHASVDPRRRFVRGPGLPHHPEGLVVSALRAFDARLRQGLRDLIEDEGLGGFLLPRSCDLRRRRVLPGEGALVPARITVQLPLHRKHEGAALRTEHEALGETKGACDKKVVWTVRASRDRNSGGHARQTAGSLVPRPGCGPESVARGLLCVLLPRRPWIPRARGRPGGARGGSLPPRGRGKSGASASQRTRPPPHPRNRRPIRGDGLAPNGDLGRRPCRPRVCGMNRNGLRGR